jgi:hypothetical protein
MTAPTAARWIIRTVRFHGYGEPAEVASSYFEYTPPVPPPAKPAAPAGSQVRQDLRRAVLV